jgi:mannose-6-phosphate isomerase-like protein (cupin superfamily)
MTMGTQHGIRYVSPESGETLWIMGDEVTFKTDGERDGVTLFVSRIPPGGGPPPHVHYLQEEAHYVLEGIFSFLNGSEWIEARAGAFIWIPRGVRHTFRNSGSEPGRLFSTNTLPGAHERWFRHVGVPMPDRAAFQPPQGAPDMAEVLTSAARQDIHLEIPDHA